jgi:hypothetical protein
MVVPVYMATFDREDTVSRAWPAPAWRAAITTGNTKPPAHMMIADSATARTPLSTTSPHSNLALPASSPNRVSFVSKLDGLVMRANSPAFDAIVLPVGQLAVALGRAAAGFRSLR